MLRELSAGRIPIVVRACDCAGDLVDRVFCGGTPNSCVSLPVKRAAVARLGRALVGRHRCQPARDAAAADGIFGFDDGCGEQGDVVVGQSARRRKSFAGGQRQRLGRWWPGPRPDRRRSESAVPRRGRTSAASGPAARSRPLPPAGNCRVNHVVRQHSSRFRPLRGITRLSGAPRRRVRQVPTLIAAMRPFLRWPGLLQALVQPRR